MGFTNITVLFHFSDKWESVRHEGIYATVEKEVVNFANVVKNKNLLKVLQ